MRSFACHIARVNEVLFHGDAESLTVPGADGELTVLAKHEPLITTLKEGTIRVRTESGEQTFAVDRGLLEVSNSRATVLV